MARLMWFLTVFLFVCPQWRKVHCDRFKPLNDDTYNFASETNYIDETSLSSVVDEEAYTSPVDTISFDSYTVTNAGDVPDDTAVLPEYTDDVLYDEAVTSPEETGDGGFDLYEDDNEPSTSLDDDDDVGTAADSFASCGTGNPVDDCWRCDHKWDANRQALAGCGVGFGKGALGGKNGKIYVVTSTKDDDAANPAPGTLRYAVTRLEPLWIIFATSMTIKLKNELLITSYKTIDGRGVSVKIAGGGGLTMQRVNNIIVHGITIQDIKPTGPARIMTSTDHTGKRGKCDGDAISIFTSKNIWIDHCYLSNAADGLIDVIRGSTAVSITNCYFTKHDKVMLFGANKNDKMDKDMQVTVAYNTFGPGLVQRMPRVRFGSVHVVNNDYTSGWTQYAIAGSECPTILSQGNIFNAAKGKKQVTKSINDGGDSCGGPQTWSWKSEGDTFQAGAYFTSTPMAWSSSAYAKTYSTSACPTSLVHQMCRGSGPLNCRQGARC